MSQNTSIEWTDHTWNPWHGCHKISPGCKLCYMFRDKARYGQDPNVVVRSKTKFNDPLSWPKAPAMCFTCSWSDWLIEEADEWRDEAYDIIRRTPWITYQILTKRIERAKGRVPDPPLPNIWWGVSAENQKYADERIPLLLSTPAAIRFVSYEPALGPIDFARIDYRQQLRDTLVKAVRWAAEKDGAVDVEEQCREAAASVPEGDLGMGNNPELDVLTGAWFDGWDSGKDGGKIDWVIAGGESGGMDVRAAHPQWFRAVRDQCVSAGVPFFFKQWGEYAWRPTWGDSTGKPKHIFDDGVFVERIGKKAAGAMLDGREWREFPNPAHVEDPAQQQAMFDKLMEVEGGKPQ